MEIVFFDFVIIRYTHITFKNEFLISSLILLAKLCKLEKKIMYVFKIIKRGLHYKIGQTSLAHKIEIKYFPNLCSVVFSTIT